MMPTWLEWVREVAAVRRLTVLKSGPPHRCCHDQPFVVFPLTLLPSVLPLHTGTKCSSKVAVPANIYNRGFLNNVCEVLHPLSFRRADLFAEARAVNGTILGFAAAVRGEDSTCTTTTFVSKGAEQADVAHLHSD